MPYSQHHQLRNRIAARNCQRNNRTSAAEAGFTLVELLVVLGILALVATLAAPNVIRYLGSAKSQTAKTQISNLVGAVELYYLDVQQYPQQSIGLTALIQAPTGVDNWSGPYIRQQKAIVDPWGQPYQYRFPGKHGAFDIFTLGRDTKQGGDGEDQDITSW